MLWPSRQEYKNMDSNRISKFDSFAKGGCYSESDQMIFNTPNSLIFIIIRQQVISLDISQTNYNQMQKPRQLEHYYIFF